MNERSEIKRVIFTDPGLDDAAALLHLSRERKTPATALVSSSGNVSEKQAYINISTLRGIFHFPKNWVMARGSALPLNISYCKYSNMAIYKGNGPDGLWNKTNPNKVRRASLSDGLIHLDEKAINEIISLAPLTGPVLLQRMGAHPAKTLIMGGAFLEGNVRPIGKDRQYEDGFPRVAEWNFFKDADAAKEYFKKYAGLNVWVVTKDACMATLLTADQIIKGETKPSIDHRFMKRILESWAIEYGKVNPSVVKRGLILPDLVAIISYQNPDLAVWEETGIEIVDQIGPDLGRSLRTTNNPKCRVATGIKADQVKILFEAINETVFGIK